MKIVLIVAASAVALISGCASVPNTGAIAYNDNVDTARVAAIENVARSRGVTVVWVNYPTKKSTAAGVVPAPTGS